MIKSKDIFLKELANLPELQENILSLVFGLNPDIDISKREKFFDNVLPFYERYKEQELRTAIEIKIEDNQMQVEKWKGKDLRIKKVRIKSVRGFPESPTPFGISFVDEKNEPQSMILLGSNGTGKSSLYSAIEYCYCGEVSEAKLRNFKPQSSDRYKEFLQNFNNPISKSFCEIAIADKEIKYFKLYEENIPESVRKKINPNTHLVSDWDIYSNGQLDYLSSDDKSFHYLIANSLGLNEHLEFEKQLKSFILYPRQIESRRISSFQKSIETQHEIISSRKLSIAEKRMQSESLRENEHEVPVDERIQNIIGILNQVKQTNFSFRFDYQTFLNQLNDFKQQYREFIAKKVKTGAQNEIQFLNIGIELLNDASQCPFCESSTKGVDDIKRDVLFRIESISSMNKSLQELNKSFSEISESLLSLNNQIGLLKSKAINEMSLIQAKSEFNDLTQIDNSFLMFLSQYLGEYFFVDLSNLNENPNYQKDKIAYLYVLLYSHEEYLNKQLSKFLSNISYFLTNREKQLLAMEALIPFKARGKTIGEQKAIIESEIALLESQISAATKIIDEAEQEVVKFQEQQKRFDEIRIEARQLQKVIHSKLSIEVELAFEPIKAIVEQILEYYFELTDRNAKVKIEKVPEVDLETGELLSETISAFILLPGKGESPIEVNRYFNTFHYRLFSTMVSISIAIASRINTGINLPLILDDVFYATDFENRTTIERFIKNVFFVFGRYTKELPLQLILFTHDQLIFESSLKASHNNKIESLNFAKLYSLNNVKQKDDYLNLIYIFPRYLPQAIVDSILTEA